jgi:hypothetical protein
MFIGESGVSDFTVRPRTGPQSFTLGKRHAVMIRLRLYGLSCALAAVFLAIHPPAAVTSPFEEGADMFRRSGHGPARVPIASERWMVAAAASALSAQEWLDTIRPPLRDEGPQTVCPGVGGIAFNPGTAEPSADGKRTLDGLGAALASPSFENSKFRILWLADAGASSGLAERRASKIEADLRSTEALPPGRLVLMPASAAFEDCSQPVPADTLLLQVGIAGRWWGGQ